VPTPKADFIEPTHPLIRAATTLRLEVEIQTSPALRNFALFIQFQNKPMQLQRFAPEAKARWQLGIRFAITLESVRKFY
jgi:hypothetical protein